AVGCRTRYVGTTERGDWRRSAKTHMGNASSMNADRLARKIEELFGKFAICYSCGSNWWHTYGQVPESGSTRGTFLWCEICGEPRLFQNGKWRGDWEHSRQDADGKRYWRLVAF